MLRSLIIFLLPVLSYAAAPDLIDQYGESYAINGEDSVLVIVATPKKLRWVGKWEERLRKELPELNSYRVTAALDTPPPGYEAIAENLRKRVPKDVSIAIDTEGVWASKYDLDISEPCLLLLDADRQLVKQYRGRPKGELLKTVRAELQPYFPNTADSGVTED